MWFLLTLLKIDESSKLWVITRFFENCVQYHSIIHSKLQWLSQTKVSPLENNRKILKLALLWRSDIFHFLLLSEMCEQRMATSCIFGKQYSEILSKLFRYLEFNQSSHQHREEVWIGHKVRRRAKIVWRQCHQEKNRGTQNHRVIEVKSKVHGGFLWKSEESWKTCSSSRNSSVSKASNMLILITLAIYKIHYLFNIYLVEFIHEIKNTRKSFKQL